MSISGDNTLSNEPPRKKQRTIAVDEQYDCVVVKRTKLQVNFASSKLLGRQEDLERSRLPVSVTVIESSPSLYQIRIFEGTGKAHRLLLENNLPIENAPLQDIKIANLVANGARSWQNPKAQGRLWTETDIRIGCDGSDFMDISFTVKWNITTSLDHLPLRRLARPALQAVLSTYYDLLDERAEPDRSPWLAQNFYESVHVPETDDPIADSIVSKQLTSPLYGFQKRSVKWLLEREGVTWSKEDTSIVELVRSRQTLPYSFHQATDGEGQDIYISSLLDLVTKDVEPYRQVEQLRGGMICEEMGLGKTVEIIALIDLHRRPPTEGPVFDPFLSTNLRPTSATLIITPPSILSQWMTELALHSPGLKIMHYEGLKGQTYDDATELLDRLATHDVVLTTYNVLSSEVHYTLPPADRQLRGGDEKKYPVPKSPLVQLSWWRVCLDEAQMIENGVSNAAKVARLIPRVNAWAVTGTPVQKDVADVLGLLIFLRLEPFASFLHIWPLLVRKHRESFKNLIGQVALRHTKHLVRDELRLPGQQRFVITIPFTPIEEQHYQSLFQQMCEDCNLDAYGNPLREDWDPNDPDVIEQMRIWLVRLRQTALHPEVGGRNRRALGHKQGPLRTVDDVLTAMLEQSELSIRTDQRAFFLAKLKRGQTLENGPEVKEALIIWTEVLREASNMVLECRQQLEKEVLANRVEGANLDSSTGTEDSSDDETSQRSKEENAEASSRIGTFRNRLRAALEVEHMATFFQANGYFQIKSNEEMTKSGSQEFKDLERLEAAGYEKAKEIRQEILKEIFRKVNRLMTKVSKRASSQAFAQIPEFPSSSPQGGMESRRIMEQLNELCIALDAQANQLDEWREQAIKFLLRSLVDEDEGIEITGDEYEESTKTQDELLVLVQVLRTVIEDRHDALTGQENMLIKGDVKTSLKLAKDGEGLFPEKVIELFKIRGEVKPPKETSVRGVISSLRALSTQLKMDAENGSTRAAMELRIVDAEREKLQRQYSEQSKAVVALRKEIELFTDTMNTRLEYYRQLQQVSDMVAPLEEGESPDLRAQLVAEEEKLSKRIATSSAKHRYLIHLRNEASADKTEQRICVICQSTFEIGALTVCGHQYCKECMGLWWAAHHNCPVCKRKLTRDDLHDITYKPQELKMAEEVIVGVESPVASSKISGIYSEINANTLEQIKEIELDGPSFTTKVDSIARHLIWLRDSVCLMLSAMIYSID